MKRLSIFILFISFLTGCDDKGGFEKINNFDQQPMLVNFGENLILPAYENLVNKNLALKNAFSNLHSSVTDSTISAFKDSLKAARLAWQSCTPYMFGPAETVGLLAEHNIYPVDKFQIDNNISSSFSYDLDALSNSDAKGYPALGYLIYGDPQDGFQELTAARLQYMSDVIDRMVSASQQVCDTWTNSYLDEFTSESALGIDIGSSVGKLVNAINMDFERNTRDGKVGIPVGVRSLGETIPTASEAYFSEYSVALLKANMEAYKELFLGQEGIGFDDYLKEIGAATNGNEDLADKIIEQFGSINTAISKISDPLPDAILNQKTDVERIFAEMQTLVVYFKTDMASSIGVVISYQDNDGD